MEYKIEIEAFEGPMDLLLHLIDKAEIDIYDIPINIITEQFVGYIRQMEDLNLDIASEFLVMAATLLEIKSKLLLPNKTTSEDLQMEMEVLDPRMELVRRLVEYKKYKDVVESLKLLESHQSKVYYKPNEDLSFYEDEEPIDISNLDINILLKSINNIIKKRSKERRFLDINEIQRDEYTLEDCMKLIKDRIFEKNIVKFTDLLKEDTTKKEIITYFLSILELISMKIIIVEQEEDFSDLILLRKEQGVD